MPRLKVCSRPGCPNLTPCPTHSQPAVKDTRPRWSKNRDPKAQYHFRKAVLARDGHQCTRCGSSDQLHAHHVRPGYDPSCGVTLCRACHRAVDKRAR